MNPGQMRILRKILTQIRAEMGPTGTAEQYPFHYWVHRRLWDMVYMEEVDARTQLSLPWISFPSPED